MGRACTRGLPFREWPATDRQLWARLTAGGGPLDPVGPLSHLRQTSLETFSASYGFFLGHLQRSGVDLERTDPSDRASEVELRSYLRSLEDLSARTKSGYFAALYRILSAGYPDRDWTHLRAAKINLHRHAQWVGSARDKTAIPQSTELIELGARLMMESESKETCARAEKFRDGLMILLLAYHPLRIGNFAKLAIGRSISFVGAHWKVHLPRDETKSGREIAFTLSPPLSVLVSEYVRMVRMEFPGGGDQSTGFLWLRTSGQSWGKKAIGRHISRLTETGLGRRVTPHEFRHAAATTVAVTEGSDARMIRPLLAHTSSTTSEEYYILAKQIEAARLYHRALHELGGH